MGAAAENRPVIGSWQLGPDEALVVEVDASGGPVLELLAGEPVVGDDRLRAPPEQPQRASGGRSTTTGSCAPSSLTHDPGVANWLDTAGHSAGPVIFRCVRTETAPVPTTRVDPVLRRRPPRSRPGPAASHPEERDSTIAARRLAVSKRFCR